MQTSIQQGIQTIRQHIIAAAQQVNRNPDDIKLLAVSKQQSIDKIIAAIHAGQCAFGENYLQEALEKIAALADYALEWHFIGRIQRNKTREIAEHFAWVHTLTRPQEAQRLHEQRPPELPPLQVCIQVNINAEASKTGVSPADILPLAAIIAGLPRLNLRGLMAIPAPDQTPQQLAATFTHMQQLLRMLQQQGYAADTLSMGMSQDFPQAIAHGATMVRIGQDIFGPRPKQAIMPPQN